MIQDTCPEGCIICPVCNKLALPKPKDGSLGTVCRNCETFIKKGKEDETKD